MQIKEYELGDIARGVQVDMWLFGLLGALITTIPAFVVMIVWFVFVSNYKIVDENNEVAKGACIGICFAGGVLCWLIFIALAMAGA